MSSDFVTVYAEATPNPESLKFVFNRPIINTSSSYNFENPEQAQASPLAAQLFQFSFVRGVYISSDFVTVTKDAESMWAELIPILRTFLKEYVGQNRPVLPEEMLGTDSMAIHEGDTETVKQIKELLIRTVKPVVEQDGGNIEFVSFDENGIVTLALKGSCSGCPSSSVTLKNGIENLLKRVVPEVQGVVAESV